MELTTSAFERALHLALYVVGVISIGVIALALLERLAGPAGRRTIRLGHVGIGVGVFLLLIVAERLYHAIH